MKKFTSKITLYFIGLSIIIAPLLFYKIGGKSWRYIDNPTALIIEKTERLENLESPKVVIVGGSSSFFGMNSKIIENSLSKPVVNMAQFAGFGLDFILKQTEDNINQGDIIFLCSEYYLGADINDDAVEQILKYYPAATKHFPETEITFFSKITNNFHNNIESIFNFVLVPISRRSPIYKHSRVANEYGDNIGYLNYNTPSKSKIKERDYSYYDGIEIIKRYIEKANERGGEVYIIFPPIPKTDYLLNKRVFNKYHKDYLDAFNNHVLCTPEEMVFNDSQFFDTWNHLDGALRDERTNRMVDFYNRAIN